MNNSLIRTQRGLTIIELMVAMAIGLILMLGATGVLLTNQQAFRTTESLSGIQEASRIAVELISRDVREAGGHPCLSMSVVDMTGGDAAGAALKTQLTAGVTINPADNPGNRDTSQGAIRLVGADNIQTITAYNSGGKTLTASNDLKANDFVIVCTSKSAYLMKVTSANSSSFQVSSVPSTNLLGGTLVSGLDTQLWYIGTNANGRINSLYRRTGTAGNGTEMVDNVAGLTVTQQGTTAFKLDLAVCSNNAEPDGLITADQSTRACPAGRIERRTYTVIQRRAA